MKRCLPCAYSPGLLSCRKASNGRDARTGLAYLHGYCVQQTLTLQHTGSGSLCQLIGCI
jgi:hypothetical protein